ncbi:MAG: nucleotidyl transferase AbiEii/AbiGii toxin family protein [Candidatus Thermoplasmatota archaeon]|nr:nucleotidyl transferase AbiEii/AbiGii toxin family protein [Candidatus Thermoplasmatota archaeon]
MEPIGSFLSGQRLKLAELQDYIIDIIYDRIQPAALLYGGTAIWRCFGSTRFSENIDIYMDSSAFEDLLSVLEKYGISLIWQDLNMPTRIRLSKNSTDILLETKPGHAENQIHTYYRIDGSTKTINVLSPTELMIRKTEAYQGRRFIRDIYELYVLTNWLNKSDYTVRSRLSNFLQDLATPVDEKVLSSLLYAGLKNLNFTIMVNFIRRWLDEI